MFLRGFSGFAMNCSDDIALNTAAAFSGYSASGLPAYLLGVFAGAALMVAIVVFSRGKAKIGAGWKTQCAFYLLASAAILWNSLPPGFQFPVFRI